MVRIIGKISESREVYMKKWTLCCQLVHQLKTSVKPFLVWMFWMELTNKRTLLFLGDLCDKAVYFINLGSWYLYSQHRLISPRLIEHSRKITDFLGTGRPH